MKQFVDSIYTDLKNSLALIEGYTEIKNLAFILKACRAKPFKYTYESKLKKAILYDHWIDEHHNSIYLKNKKIIPLFNDISLLKYPSINTDLYSGLDIYHVMKISKFVYVYYGLDEDYHTPYLHINFLGIDDYLRSFVYLYGDLENISPLTLGMFHLQILARNRKIQTYKKFNVLLRKKWSPYPCQETSQWLTCLPAPENFFSDLKIQCPILYELFKENQY